jgi:hypothetical protein
MLETLAVHNTTSISYRRKALMPVNALSYSRVCDLRTLYNKKQHKADILNQ